jgi:hypothetical protein
VGLIFANIGLSLSVAGQPIVDESMVFRSRHHCDRDNDVDAACAQVELGAQRPSLGPAIRGTRLMPDQITNI